MQKVHRRMGALWHAGGILLMALLLLSSVAAGEPMLAVRLVEGESSIYQMSYIERVRF